MIIDDYFYDYWWLLMIILWILMIINNCFMIIDNHWWLFYDYWWLFYDYWRLFYHYFMIIDDYFMIVDDYFMIIDYYWWLFYDYWLLLMIISWLFYDYWLLMMIILLLLMIILWLFMIILWCSTKCYFIILLQVNECTLTVNLFLLTIKTIFHSRFFCFFFHSGGNFRSLLSFEHVQLKTLELSAEKFCALNGEKKYTNTNRLFYHSVTNVFFLANQKLQTHKH